MKQDYSISAGPFTHMVKTVTHKDRVAKLVKYSRPQAGLWRDCNPRIPVCNHCSVIQLLACAGHICSAHPSWAVLFQDAVVVGL